MLDSQLECGDRPAVQTHHNQSSKPWSGSMMILEND